MHKSQRRPWAIVRFRRPRQMFGQTVLSVLYSDSTVLSMGTARRCLVAYIYVDLNGQIVRANHPFFG